MMVASVIMIRCAGSALVCEAQSDTDYDNHRNHCLSEKKDENDKEDDIYKEEEEKPLTLS